MLQKLNKKRNQKGFTLVELLIVIAIIGILAAIAIPQFSTYRKKAYDSAALSDAKNAYTAAQAYFGDNPTGTPSLNDLANYGFKGASQGVNVTISGAGQDDLTITASHEAGTKIITITSDGQVQQAPKQ
jgi:type IV pilus assembly protein PilA